MDDTEYKMYTAAILDHRSVDSLRNQAEQLLGDLSAFRFSTSQGHRLPHHMTVNLGSLDESLNPRSMLGRPVILKVNKLARNDSTGVCAACVETSLCESSLLRSANAQPHITICIMPWAKPKDSNAIFLQKDTFWTDADLELYASLAEIN